MNSISRKPGTAAYTFTTLGVAPSMGTLALPRVGPVSMTRPTSRGVYSFNVAVTPLTVVERAAPPEHDAQVDSDQANFGKNVHWLEDSWRRLCPGCVYWGEVTQPVVPPSQSPTRS
jgi:hypothetical protein